MVPLLVPVLALLGLGLFCWWTIDPNADWLLVPRPPLPPGATGVQTYYPSIDIQRITEFHTNQTAHAIQEFYRRELTKGGWTHRSTREYTNLPCGTFGLPGNVALHEVYTKGTDGSSNSQHMVVSISMANPDGRRMVGVSELEPGSWSPPIESSPTPLGPTEAALVDYWEGTDAASGADFMVCFYVDGHSEMLLPDGNSYYGEYSWVGNDAIRMTFHATTPHVEGDQGLCTHAPPFLIGFCQYSVPVSNNVPYPGPGEPTPLPPPTPTPAPAYPYPYSGPYPFPAANADSRVDEVFNVDIEGETLTLTHASGATQTFQRVMGE